MLVGAQALRRPRDRHRLPRRQRPRHTARAHRREQRQPPHRLPHADPAPRGPQPGPAGHGARARAVGAFQRPGARIAVEGARTDGRGRAQKPQERLPGPGREGDHALGRLLVGRRHPRPRRARQDHGARRGGVPRRPRRPGRARRRQLGQGAAERLGVQPGRGAVQEGQRRAAGIRLRQGDAAPALRARGRLPPHGRERRADPRGRRAGPRAQRPLGAEQALLGARDLREVRRRVHRGVRAQDGDVGAARPGGRRGLPSTRGGARLHGDERAHAAQDPLRGRSRVRRCRRQPTRGPRGDEQQRILAAERQRAQQEHRRERGRR